jgi:oligopeptide transport system ATP-binding protein
MAQSPDTQPLLEVRDLRVQFNTYDGLVRAVDGVSFSVPRARTLGIVGESGSGKTVANLAVMGLIPKPPGIIPSGQALFQGQDLMGLNREQMRRIRGRRIAMIFQDPMTSLNPFLRISTQMTEAMELHLGLGRKQALDRAVELLEKAGIPAAARRISSYPHQFSGGMRQRVMIAMALSCGPDLLIADEPTTALDVTIQAQILELLKSLQEQTGTGIILITHDLGIVAGMCHEICVMYAGRIVEQAATEDLFARPMHPYTLGLLRSLPRLDADAKDKLTPIPGLPPDLIRTPPGCSFEPRCAFRIEKCKTQAPPLMDIEPGRRSACWVDPASGNPR